MKRLFLLLLLVFCTSKIFTQEDTRGNISPINPDSLILWLSKLQADGNDFYDAGLFPSQRTHPVLNYEKEDNNIFFTGLIVMILQDISPYLSDQNRETAEEIIRKAISNYPKYRNKYGRPVYNFWQTNPSRHFPNDNVLSTLKKFILPEDFDDTSIIFLTDEKDSVEVNWLKLEMILHTNNYRLTVNNTYDKYRNYNAYSTWFGENMPIDFDINVLTNTMAMVYHYNLPLNNYDMASLKLINKMLQEEEHIENPAYISPHYKKTPVILYHLARFMSEYEPALISENRKDIIRDIKAELQHTESLMEYILLSTSLMKMGLCPEPVQRKLENDIGEYNFFVANMVSTVKDPWKKLLGSSNLFAFPYESLSYDYALLLENLIYRQLKGCSALEIIVAD